MERTRAWLIGLAVAASLGGAPATPTYVAVDSAMSRIEADWAKPGIAANPNAPGWNALFTAIRKDLATYSTSNAEQERTNALNRLYQISAALDAIAWAPAVEVRNELRTWLNPRLTLYWAGRRLVETIKGVSPRADAASQGNGTQWLKFVGDDLGAALRDYEGASEVRRRREALGRVQRALSALQQRNQAVSWAPSVELQSAVTSLYDGPNVQATADAATVSKRLANQVVASGPVYRQGQVTYVTAGPYMGFGLMASDDGIMFFNRQALSSVTPINGFQQQVEADPKGRRAAKLYQFSATSTDQSVLTIIAVLRPTGIQLFPENSHAIAASVGAAPQPGKGLARGIAALVGLNKQKITAKVYDGAIGQIQSSVIQGSREEAQEKAAIRAAQTSAQIRNMFAGPDRLIVKNFEIDAVRLRSRPEFAIIDGRLQWVGAANQAGAEMPKPAKFLVAQGGVSADIHLSSIMTNFGWGYFQDDKVKSVDNLLIVTKKVAPGTPAKDGFAITQNADFATLMKAVDETRAANDPKVMAIRLKKPKRSPEFSVDRNGYLIAIIHDFSLDVPAPEAAAKGGLGGPPAKIYRIVAPAAEFAISFQINPATAGSPPRLTGKIEAFDPGPGAKVLAINDNEAKAAPMNALAGNLTLSVFAGKLRGQPIDVPLADVNLPGFTLTSVSNVDPTGWMRVVLTPTAP